MSQSAAVRVPARHATRPVARPAPTPPRLRVVTAPAHTRSRAGAAVLCAALLAGGLVTLLLLQMSLERGAYALRDAQRQARVLGDQAQDLNEQLARLQAPQNLAARASALGMVQAPNPAFLRASDGKVLGVPAPGVKPPSPTVKKDPAPGKAAAAKATDTAGAKKSGTTTGAKGTKTAATTKPAGANGPATNTKKKTTSAGTTPTAD